MIDTQKIKKFFGLNGRNRKLSPLLFIRNESLRKLNKFDLLVFPKNIEIKV